MMLPIKSGIVTSSLLLKVFLKLLKDLDNKEKTNNFCLPIALRLIYLCDWKMAIEYGIQMTDNVYEYGNYGPVIKNEDINKIWDNSLIDRDIMVALSGAEYDIILFIFDKYLNMTGTAIYNLVYSTYPFIVGSRYDELNLIELASEYNIYKHKLRSKEI